MNLDQMPFSNGDVCEIAGIVPKTLDNWVTAGVLSKRIHHRNAGRGSQRVFSFKEAVACALAVRWQRRGFAPEEVHKVAGIGVGTNLAWLRSEVAAGREYLVPDHPDGGPRMCSLAPGLDPAIVESLQYCNVALCLEEVKAKATEIAMRPAPTGPGRRRKLSGRVM